MGWLAVVQMRIFVVTMQGRLNLKGRLNYFPSVNSRFNIWS